ncbi:hypothetical protein SHJG_8449 [Streptomyces hygroscopicus subsp. jinggangensis 5008]|nr:hypothetical protein SHJG_8449 [Streptomyces hygroscopicus subsp. jinggangensis 5008]
MGGDRDAVPAAVVETLGREVLGLRRRGRQPEPPGTVQ